MKEIYTGIVIKGIDYSASDRIITILSSDDSFVVFKARGVGKISSSLAKYTIPYSISEFELECKSETSNKTLVGASSLFFPKNINSSIEAIALFSYITESLNYVEPRVGLYEFVMGIIYDAENGKNLKLLFLKYLYYLIKCNGLTLSLNKCCKCGSKKNIVDVDYKEGGFLCSACSINRKSLEYIETLYKLGVDKQIEVDDGVIYKIVLDLLIFFNDNAGIILKSEKFLLNSLFNM